MSWLHRCEVLQKNLFSDSDIYNNLVLIYCSSTLTFESHYWQWDTHSTNKDARIYKKCFLSKIAFDARLSILIFGKSREFWILFRPFALLQSTFKVIKRPQTFSLKLGLPPRYRCRHLGSVNSLHCFSVHIISEKDDRNKNVRPKSIEQPANK